MSEDRKAELKAKVENLLSLNDDLLNRFDNYLEGWSHVFMTHIKYNLPKPKWDKFPDPWDNLDNPKAKKIYKDWLIENKLWPFDWEHMWTELKEERE